MRFIATIDKIRDLRRIADERIREVHYDPDGSQMAEIEVIRHIADRLESLVESAVHWRVEYQDATAQVLSELEEKIGHDPTDF